MLAIAAVIFTFGMVAVLGVVAICSDACNRCTYCGKPKHVNEGDPCDKCMGFSERASGAEGGRK